MNIDNTILLDDIIKFTETKIDSWLPGAMYPSEIAWLIYNIIETKCTAIIELGRQDGISTAILGEYFFESDLKIFSIDFDNDPYKAQLSRKLVSKYNVKCLSGDIHVLTPKLLKKLEARNICIIQDAAKGWEGLTTILAASQFSTVKLIGQHNLHLGHSTRILFELLSSKPAFLEDCDNFELYKSLRDKEKNTLIQQTLNRDINHTSLGMMQLNKLQRNKIYKSYSFLKKNYGIWNPLEILKAWNNDNYDIIKNKKIYSRYTLSRFKKR